MNDPLDMTWKLSKQAVANTVGDEVVILHLGNSTYYGLDPVGAMIWSGLEAGKGPAEICDDILSEFAIDRDSAKNDVAEFLLHLERNNLIEH